MSEDTMEIINEKAMKATTPPKEICGIDIQKEEKPLNTKSTILNPGTTKVTI